MESWHPGIGRPGRWPGSSRRLRCGCGPGGSTPLRRRPRRRLRAGLRQVGERRGCFLQSLGSLLARWRAWAASGLMKPGSIRRSSRSRSAVTWRGTERAWVWLATHRRRPQSSQRTIARRLPSDVLRRAPVAAHTSAARRLLDSRAFQLTPRLGHASTGVRSRPNALACGLLAAAFVSLWRSGKATRMAKLSVDSSLGDSVSSNSASSARRDCLSCASSARPESVMSTSVTRPSSGSMSLTTKSSRSSRPTNCVIAG
jgi:hypothetical protein